MQLHGRSKSQAGRMMLSSMPFDGFRWFRTRNFPLTTRPEKLKIPEIDALDDIWQVWHDGHRLQLT